MTAKFDVSKHLNFKTEMRMSGAIKFEKQMLWK